MKRSLSVVRLAVLVEGGLGVCGVLLAWWLDVPLLSRLQLSWSAAIRGCLATLPMMVALAWLVHSPWRPIVDLRTRILPLLAELFRGAGALELAVVATAAGVGEELLFRGALQPLAARWLGAEGAGLIAASLVFGALHALTSAYFVLATLVGCYLGWLALYWGDLVAPILAHAAYDFAALCVLLARQGPEGTYDADDPLR